MMLSGSHVEGRTSRWRESIGQICRVYGGVTETKNNTKKGKSGVVIQKKDMRDGRATSSAEKNNVDCTQ